MWRVDFRVRWIALPTVLVLSFLATAACGGGSGPATSGTNPASSTAADLARLTVTSSAFRDGEPVPARFSLHGENVSPPLSWTGVPQGAVELALEVVDPDAPGSTPFVHWLVAGIAPDVGSLAEGHVPAAAVQGRNGLGHARYDGPAPPSGTHHYVFTVYALAAHTGLRDGFGQADLARVIEGSELARGILTGTFSAR